MPQQANQPLPPGYVLNGYRIEKPLSSGGFSIVYLAIFPVYIAYILGNYAIARRGVAKASSFGLLVPIVAGLLSAIFFGEPFGPLKLFGAGLVLAGLIIVRTSVWRRPAAKGASV